VERELKDNLAIFDENKLLVLRSLFLCRNRLCGCDLIGQLGIPKNLLSYHLKILIEHGYVEAVRCGRKKNYRISTAQNNKVKTILKILELI
jgi:DNA-binding transcriptional ArsR family regulator